MIAPVWEQGDATNLDIAEESVDMIFTCPPYYDLERYSDDPLDLSNLENYGEFLLRYREAIARACAALKPDRFAVVVVGDIRDENGHYRAFVADTIAAFRLAGLEFHNEAILVQPVGSLPIRAGRIFSATRRLGKTHQNMLVFVKGDVARAVAACGEVEVPDAVLEAEAEPEAEDDG